MVGVQDIVSGHDAHFFSLRASCFFFTPDEQQPLRKLWQVRQQPTITYTTHVIVIRADAHPVCASSSSACFICVLPPDAHCVAYLEDRITFFLMI